MSEIYLLKYKFKKKWQETQITGEGKVMAGCSVMGSKEGF